MAPVWGAIARDEAWKDNAHAIDLCIVELDIRAPDYFPKTLYSAQVELEARAGRDTGTSESHSPEDVSN